MSWSGDRWLCFHVLWAWHGLIQFGLFLLKETIKKKGKTLTLSGPNRDILAFCCGILSHLLAFFLAFEVLVAVPTPRVGEEEGGKGEKGGQGLF